MKTEPIKHLLKDDTENYESICGLKDSGFIGEYDYSKADCKNCKRINTGEIHINGNTFKDHEEVAIWDGDYKEGAATIVLKYREGKLQWWLMDYWCSLRKIENYKDEIRKLDYKKYEEPKKYVKTLKDKLMDILYLTFAKI